jgi:hypothetical protein
MIKRTEYQGIFLCLLIALSSLAQLQMHLLSEESATMQSIHSATKSEAGPHLSVTLDSFHNTFILF